MHLYTHLNFGGNCEEAFRFYEQLLGGEITAMLKGSDLPPGTPIPPGIEELVIHARMRVAGGELIGNDVPADHYERIRSSYLFLSVDSDEAAEEIYAALADGGEVGMPLEPSFFASRFGQVRDRFGTLWTVIREGTG
jgi:PhnB protein